MSKYRKKYIKHHGEIPEGYEVHHIDMDHENNDIDNLMAIPRDIHVDIHQEWGNHGRTGQGIITKYDLDEEGNIDYSTKRKDVPSREDIKHLIIWHEVLKSKPDDTPMAQKLLNKGYPREKISKDLLKEMEYHRKR